MTGGGGLGAAIRLDLSPTSRLDGVLFGESPSRIIVTIQVDQMDQARKILNSMPAPWSEIGRVGGDRLTIVTEAAGPRAVVDTDLASLHNSWSQGLSRQMGE
jgi:phosphoribosylformylglycinamidine (FGAM) synthase-like enzyme